LKEVSNSVGLPTMRLASIATVHTWLAVGVHVKLRVKLPPKSNTCTPPSMVTVTRLLLLPPS